MMAMTTKSSINVKPFVRLRSSLIENVLGFGFNMRRTPDNCQPPLKNKSSLKHNSLGNKYGNNSSQRDHLPKPNQSSGEARVNRSTPGVATQSVPKEYPYNLFFFETLTENCSNTSTLVPAVAKRPKSNPPCRA